MSEVELPPGAVPRGGYASATDKHAGILVDDVGGKPFEAEQLKETKEEGRLARPKLKPFPFFVFCMMGTAALAGWNAMLNGVPGMIDVVYKVKDYSSTVTATYSTVVLFLTAIFVKFGWCNMWVAIAGQVFNLVTAMSFAFCSQWVTNPQTGKALFHFLSGLYGLTDVLICTSGFGYAGIFPENYGGVVSAGQGLAGVLTFTVWMISTYVIFDPDEVSGVRGSVWVLCSFVALISAITIVAEWILLSSPSARQLLQKKESPENNSIARMENCEPVFDDEEDTYELEGLRGVLQRSLPIAGANFCTLFITLVCFPVLGPLNWDNNDGKHRDILMGVFQIGDLVGRYAPNALRFMLFDRKWTQIFAYIRVVFVVFFFLCFKLSDKPFFGSFGFQFLLQALLSITNGWASSLCFMHVSRCVKGAQSRTRATSFCLFGAYTGIFAGQWVANGLILI